MSDFRHVAEGMGDREAEQGRAGERGDEPADERLEELEERIDELKDRQEGGDEER